MDRKMDIYELMPTNGVFGAKNIPVHNLSVKNISVKTQERILDHLAFAFAFGFSSGASA